MIATTLINVGTESGLLWAMYQIIYLLLMKGIFMNQIFFVFFVLCLSNNCFAFTSWAEYGQQWAQWWPQWDTSSIQPRHITYGSASFKHKTVEKELTIHGTLTLNDVLAKKLITVNGTAIVSDSKLKSITVCGCLNAKNSSFTDVKLYTTECDMQSSTASQITVDSKNQTKAPVIRLVDSTIHGDITFKDQQGTVIVSGKTVITGEIINGQLLKA